jgi:membrane-bound ClpP family serine protease
MNFMLDPNLAFVLLAVSFTVTIFALLAPGTGLLELISVLLLTLVGFTVASLPVNSWAIVLLLGGVVSVILTLKKTDNKYLVIVSIFLLLAGMLTIFKAEHGLLAVDPLLALVVSAGMGAFIWIIGKNITQASRQHVHRDLARLVGQTGHAVTDISIRGSVYVDGENWSAISDQPIKKDSQVIVTQRNGLVLKVEPVTDKKKK